MRNRDHLGQGLLFIVALGCATQLGYASVGADNSNLQFPNPLEINRSMLRVNEAWNAIRNEDSLRSALHESSNSLNAFKRVSNNRLETIKFQHFYKGLEVVGSMVMHQTTPFGSQVLNRMTQIDLNTNPRLNELEATEVAMSLLGKRNLSHKPSLKILPESEGSGARLVYWIDIDANGIDGAREVIVDANSGEVIGNVSKDIAIAPINVFNAKNQGTAITQNMTIGPNGKPAVSSCTVTDLSNGQSTQITAQKCENFMFDLPPNQCQVIQGDWPTRIMPQHCERQVIYSSVLGSEPAAMRAFQNSQIVLTYFQTHHNRNGYDNLGSPTSNLVHAGLGLNNAFWNTTQAMMVYGDGDGKTFGDFTLALDVAGHEQTHGVVAYTAQLLGWKESGALNEAFADFFGKMIANDGDWTIGRKLFLNPAQTKGFRDLANPGTLTFCAALAADGSCAQRRPFPSTIQEKMPQPSTCDGSNDNCWVHANSTIPSHASYLVVKAIGAQKAEQLYYAALTHVLTSNDNITTAARAIKDLCPKVIDAASCEAVNHAYSQVGL